MNKRNKAGFTLIELMVVAIIVAILAAVAIPLMSANKKRAMATEAQAGCSAIKTALRVMQAESATGIFPTYNGALPNAAIKGVVAGDLDGTYFITTDYSVNCSSSNFVITVTGTKAPVAGETVVMTNTVANVATFGGSLLD